MMYLDAVGIIALTFGYIIFMMVLRVLGELGASRAAVGHYLTVTGIGYELSLLFGWWVTGNLFPGRKLLSPVFKVLNGYIANFDAKLFILIIVFSFICLPVTLKISKDCDKEQKESEEVPIEERERREKRKTRCFAIGLFLFLITFVLYWDTRY